MSFTDQDPLIEGALMREWLISRKPEERRAIWGGRIRPILPGPEFRANLR